MPAFSWRRRVRELRAATRGATMAIVAGMVVTSLGGVARADVPPRLSDGLALPSQNPVSLLSTTATLVNPANLAALPGPEVRSTWIETGDASKSPIRGYAFGAAVPFLNLATGLHVDWLTPPPASTSPWPLAGAPSNAAWVRWGVAAKLSDALSIGHTLAWSIARRPELDGFVSASTGITYRPYTFLGASLVARDWNAPTNDAGVELKPSVDLGVAFRPIEGRRMLELGGTAIYRSDLDRWSAGATLAVDLPRFGTLRGGAVVSDFERPSVVANAGLEVNFDASQLAGGVVFGNALTRDGTGAYASAAVRGFVELPRLPKGREVVRIRIGSTLGARQHLRLVRRLWSLARSPDVAGVLLVPRDDVSSNMAHAEELADAIRMLRAHGKKVLCHLEDASGGELYLCAQADRIAMNPAGGLRHAGLSRTTFYIGTLLEKLGVRADFVRIGAWKSAPEQFSAGPSEAAREVQRSLLAEEQRAFLGDVAAGRGLSVDAVRGAIAGGPLLAPEARDAKLIDALVYEDEVDRFVEESFGERMRVVDLGDLPIASDHWRTPSRVAVVYLQGDMIDGESRDIPLVGIKLAGSVTVSRALKRVREDRSVKAVIFRVETGGGSSLAADVIWREAMLTARVKPLIVSMGSKAASGGYYAAVAGREVFANRSTITGSIGIFYGKVDASGLLDKLGVSLATTRSEPRADAESLFRPFTDDEHAVLGRKVKQFYDLFVGRVAEGRHMTPDAVHAVAQGRVWTGRQAAERGLVDRVGGFRQALERARLLGDLPEDAPILELPEVPKTLLDRALSLVGAPKAEAREAALLPPPVLATARALLPLSYLGFERPMARLEWVFLEP